MYRLYKDTATYVDRVFTWSRSAKYVRGCAHVYIHIERLYAVDVWTRVCVCGRQAAMPAWPMIST